MIEKDFAQERPSRAVRGDIANNDKPSFEPIANNPDDRP